MNLPLIFFFYGINELGYGDFYLSSSSLLMLIEFSFLGSDSFLLV